MATSDQLEARVSVSRSRSAKILRFLAWNWPVSCWCYWVAADQFNLPPILVPLGTTLFSFAAICIAAAIDPSLVDRVQNIVANLLVGFLWGMFLVILSLFVIL